MPLAFFTAWRRWAWGEAAREGAGKETEELRPLRPLPGTEVPGTEVSQGATLPYPRAQSAPGPLRLGYSGPASTGAGGRFRMLLLVLLKVARRGPTYLPLALPVFPENSVVP